MIKIQNKCDTTDTDLVEKIDQNDVLMELKGLLCHETFAGDDCSLEVYKFDEFEYISESEYSGTARFEITLKNKATDINKLKDEYRKSSINSHSFPVRFSTFTNKNSELWTIVEQPENPNKFDDSCGDLDNCNGLSHGSCQEGRCYCNDDWIGEKCEIPTCADLGQCGPGNGFCQVEGENFKCLCHV